MFQIFYDGTENSRGVVVTGGVGCGKTAIVEQLMEYSCFGEGRGGLITHDGEQEIITTIT